MPSPYNESLFGDCLQGQWKASCDNVGPLFDPVQAKNVQGAPVGVNPPDEGFKLVVSPSSIRDARAITSSADVNGNLVSNWRLSGNGIRRLTIQGAIGDLQDMPYHAPNTYIGPWWFYSGDFIDIAIDNLLTDVPRTTPILVIMDPMAGGIRVFMPPRGRECIEMVEYSPNAPA